MSEQETEVPVEDPEQPDETETEQPDETEQPEAPQGDTPESMEKRFKGVERSFNTYKSSVDRNLEEYALDLLPCPMCFGTPHPAFVNKHDMGRVPDDVQGNVKMFLGLAREKDYPASDTHNRCSSCQGLGKVSTGSLVPDHATITCHACNGFGYMPPPSRADAATIPNGGQPEHSAATPHDFEQPDRDSWGEPRVLPDGTLNENYGKMPQFKTDHPVYGRTADLTPEELVAGS